MRGNHAYYRKLCAALAAAPLLFSSQLMAGINIVKSGSTLKITGDYVTGNNDFVEVTENPTSGEFMVVGGTNEVFVNGVLDPDDMETFTGIKNIKADLGAGDDSFYYIGDDSSEDSELSGNLEISNSHNLNFNDASGGVNIKGKLKITQTGSGYLFMGIDDVGDEVSSVGSIDIDASDGDFNGNFSGVLVKGNVNIELGLGNNNTYVNGGNSYFDIGGNFTVMDGKMHSFDMTNGRVKGQVIVEAQANTISDSLSSTFNRVNVGKGIKVEGGIAGDYVSIHDTQTGKELFINLGDGSNSLNIYNSDIGSNLMAKKPGKLSSVDISETRIHRRAMIDSSASVVSDSPLSFNCNSCEIESGLTVYGGEPDDYVSLNQALIGGGKSLHLGLGEGENSFYTYATTFLGNVLSSSKDHFTNINLSSDVHVRGSVRFPGPPSMPNNANIDFSGAYIGRGAVISTGTGDDTFNSYTTTYGGGKSLVTNLGEGTNSVNLSSQNKFSGDIINTSAGHLTGFLLDDAFVRGNVNINASNTPSSESLAFYIQRVEIKKGLTAQTGEGHDGLYFTGLRVGGKTKITTGPGNDVVKLDYDDADGLPSDFLGTFSLDLQDGESDVVDFSDASSLSSGEAARFFSKATFDGGPGGSDTVDAADYAVWRSNFGFSDFESGVP